MKEGKFFSSRECRKASHFAGDCELKAESSRNDNGIFPESRVSLSYRPTAEVFIAAFGFWLSLFVFEQQRLRGFPAAFHFGIWF